MYAVCVWYLCMYVYFVKHVRSMYARKHVGFCYDDVSQTRI